MSLQTLEFYLTRCSIFLSWPDSFTGEGAIDYTPTLRMTEFLNILRKIGKDDRRASRLKDTGDGGSDPAGGIREGRLSRGNG